MIALSQHLQKLAKHSRVIATQRIGRSYSGTGNNIGWPHAPGACTCHLHFTCFNVFPALSEFANKYNIKDETLIGRPLYLDVQATSPMVGNHVVINQSIIYCIE